ncbi:ABC transporter substrate-binding protein [Altererythrobacter lutimaris]|uniref:Peptide ABC transporter substrate-binding protein n=1 Tax=Altererythrobacter lutimaris TaxID=2743979 RepID=A0A850H7F2_9SPHN|nr:ABC transporter substrate-binding protein [Altererythrobacter lutimaris]NVE95097.1 peptide ABC transporter substrate-binding protein [Altererythrobacter lutimaris]
MRIGAILFSLALLAACNRSDAGGPLDIAVIGAVADAEQEDLTALTIASAHLRAATKEGLVALDPSGEILPAIAERWIVTDDGMSYIFRLRDSDWPDGEPITAEDIRDALQDNIVTLSGSALAYDLAKIDQIRAMTGRVVEIQLKSPMPDFMRLLAQPEMGFERAGLGTGPMAEQSQENSSLIELAALPPEARGLPARQNWSELTRSLFVRTLPAERAVSQFADGEIDLVLGGTIAHLPLADTGPLSAGTVRLDAPLGLLGLKIVRPEGLLADAPLREAISMAIDRSDLMQPFNFGGWQASTLIYPGSLAGENSAQQERWEGQTIDERRATAARRVSGWKTSAAAAEFGGLARLKIFMPDGPGSDLLFEQLREDLSGIGVEAIRAEDESDADLRIFDALARYYSPRWYLNQFHCGLDEGLCSAKADALVEEALEVRDLVAKQEIYAEAQAALIAQEVFIPLGQPVRWSLVRAGVSGYEENQWGLHALFPLALNPI